MSSSSNDLFGPPPPVGPYDSAAARAAAGSLPYQPHSAASREAAKKAAGGAGADRQRVLDFLRGRGAYGATDEEVRRETGVGENSHRARRIELVDRGLVRDSGLKRPTASGNRATVWVATE